MSIEIKNRIKELDRAGFTTGEIARSLKVTEYEVCLVLGKLY